MFNNIGTNWGTHAYNYTNLYI